MVSHVSSIDHTGKLWLLMIIESLIGFTNMLLYHSVGLKHSSHSSLRLKILQLTNYRPIALSNVNYRILAIVILKIEPPYILSPKFN